VASEVVNDGNDTGQLYEMAKAAKEGFGVATLTALADSGYYNSNALKGLRGRRDHRSRSARQADRPDGSERPLHP